MMLENEISNLGVFEHEANECLPARDEFQEVLIVSVRYGLFSACVSNT